MLYVIFIQGCGFNCKNYLNESISPYDINGIVVSKIKSDIGCFGDIKLKGPGKLDSLNICYCVPKDQRLWDNVEVGDSLIKNVGSLSVKVYKNDTLTGSYNYPCCDQ